MKQWLFLPIFGMVFFFPGCSDISEVRPAKQSEQREVVPVEKSRLVEKSKPVLRSYVFPFSRTLRDTEGRELEARILGKQGNELALERNDDGSRFIIPLERLGEEDRKYFASAKDGGDFEPIREQLAREARFAGRVARWNSQLQSALSESRELDLPVFLLVLVNKEEKSAELEKSLLYSREFKAWASKHLVLCCLRIDDPNSRHNAGPGAAANREAVSAYTTTYDKPSIMLIDPDGRRASSFSASSVDSPENAISVVERVVYR